MQARGAARRVDLPGRAAGTVLRSTDQGLSWSAVAVSGAPDLRAVAARASLFVAVGLDGVILRSTDAGVTWNSVSQPTSTDLLGVAASPDRFVAVGAAGTIVRGGSTAASGSWFDVSVDLGATLHAVLHDGADFYATGDLDLVLRSNDGTSWLNVPVTAIRWGDVKQHFRVH